MPRHRRCIVLRGTKEQTRREALRLVEAIPTDDVLWVSPDDDLASPCPVRPRRVHSLLGQAFDAVVLDLHDELDANVIGQCHGFIWGGGALVLRLPPLGQTPDAGRHRLTAYPYSEDAVGHRFYRHLERVLARAALASARPLSPAPHGVGGTAAQARVVEQLADVFCADAPSVVAVLADRGRGKSSALGLALEEALARVSLRVAVTASHRDAVAEIRRFAPDAFESGRVAFSDVSRVLEVASRCDVVLVDEAAQLPVPILQRLVEAHPQARIVFATTVRGYEGTGRGFMLRFLAWLRRRERPVQVLTLEEPIRWERDDPVERLVFEALLLDAEPAPLETPIDVDAVKHVRLDRDALVEDEAMLREFFGLLVHAHYRTTPGDLHRLLDAPNLHLHALVYRGHVVAATLVAEEGALSPQLVDEVYHGRTRIRGHALPEILISHAGRREAGAMRMIRSVRIAVHPELRRLGLASMLVEHVHETYAPDLFGTLFGATPQLLRFRRSVGYELVRIGASRGSRTGEPAAVMMRPVSTRARALCGSLREDLSGDLPLQLELMQADEELVLDPALVQSLTRELGPASPLSSAARREALTAYAFGPRTFEAAARAVCEFVEAHAEHLDELQPAARALIEGRVRRRRSWGQVMADAQQPTLRATMRGLRRAVRDLVLRVEPELAPEQTRGPSPDSDANL